MLFAALSFLYGLFLAPVRSAIYHWSWDLATIPYEILKENNPEYADRYKDESRLAEAYLEPLLSYWMYWRWGPDGWFKLP